MTFAYLASPYTDPDPAVREQRFQAAARAAAKLMTAGKIVFCPIAHSHPIDLFFSAPKDGEFWKRQDAPYLEACSEMYVLRIDGWEQSKGMLHEMQRAAERGIPVHFIDGDGE